MHIDLNAVLAIIGSIGTFVVGWFLKSPLYKQVNDNTAKVVGKFIESLMDKTNSKEINLIEAGLLISIGNQLVEIGNNVIKKNNTQQTLPVA